MRFKRQSKLYKNLMVLFFLGTLFTGCATIQPDAPVEPVDLTGPVFSHEQFDTVLMRSVDNHGRVNYALLKENATDLDAYLHLVASYSPDSHPDLFPTTNHQLAYWINAYNAYAIKAVLVNYPISSVLDVKTPFWAFFLTDKAGFFIFQRFMFGGKTTNLYYLENGVIRKRFNDPRIHFAVNCASIGCPQLPNQAFKGEQLDEQLIKETRKFVAEDRNVRIDHENKTILLSSIFKWYESDFSEKGIHTSSGDLPPLIAYILNYLASEKATALKAVAQEYTIRFIPYDWGLNDQR